MREFCVYSSDENVNFAETKSVYGYATSVFRKECAIGKAKCAVAKHLIDQGATMQTPRLPVVGQYYVFNFPTDVDIDTIRRSIIAIPEICKKCQQQR
ncbi:MAG: hypothetical protein J6T57_04520 [Alphaproteobacteria bacterium]|nr:hypothetical protein [Alphaproteobacteria bacterium]